ncbi:class I SAM-dependent RNA methyltransferase [uncultured Jatrophihabitans sp.]|uniref:class I SAM-dependent RNA methyltransferase n=1 Tax=uncultured Jatrophihabitans sp. TaxID=1610747 RepID=UPI0035CBF05B
MSEPGAPLVGTVLELDVGAVAQGGSCVARHGGRVVFVRHALPGERVRAVVTEDRRASFLRADAVEILHASADRVRPPCPYAGPGRCGGCDWQHATADAQRRFKAAVIRDQFARLGGIDLGDLLREVEPLPGGLLGWRTRVAYAVDADGRPGLRRHASHDVEHVDACLLGVAGVGDSPVLAGSWPGCNGVEVVRGDDGALTELTHRPAVPKRHRGRRAHGRRAPDRVAVHAGPLRVRHDVGSRRFEVSAAGFWQVHPAAAAIYTHAVIDALATAGPLAGAKVLELYAGAGALTAALAEAVGAGGLVTGVELDPGAVEDAAANLADLPQATVRQGKVSAAAVAELGAGDGVDLVVLDPPRTGAGPHVMAALAALRPRAMAYLSCDAGTLARDVAAAREAGWNLTALRAFDAFPMTAHVECLALLRPGGAAAESSDTADLAS